MDRWRRGNGWTTLRRTRLLAPSAPITTPARCVPSVGVDAHAVRVNGHVGDARAGHAALPRGARHRAGPRRRRRGLQRSATVGPCASSGERHDGRAATSRIEESRRPNHALRKPRAVDGVGDHRQGAAGDAAAAWLLARMRRVEDRDARAAPRERIGRPRPGRTRADDAQRHRAH